jgi:hypothetical protein
MEYALDPVRAGVIVASSAAGGAPPAAIIEEERPMLGRTLAVAFLAVLLAGSTGCHRKGMFCRRHSPCCSPCLDMGGCANDCGCASFYPPPPGPPAPPTAIEVPAGPMPPVPVGHFTPTR